MNDSYLGAGDTGNAGDVGDVGLPGGPARRAVRTVRKSVITALVLTALAVGCASGCHAVVLNAKPAPHSSVTGQ